jgi:hypothetical protein
LIFGDHFVGAPVTSNVRPRAMRRIAGIFLVLGGAGVVAWGLLLFASQVYYWLRVGTWPSIATIQVFAPPSHSILFPFEPYRLIPSFVEVPHEWLAQPNDWLGLSKLVSAILTGLPLSVALMLSGFGVWFLGIVVAFGHSRVERS